MIARVLPGSPPPCCRSYVFPQRPISLWCVSVEPYVFFSLTVCAITRLNFTSRAEAPLTPSVARSSSVATSRALSLTTLPHARLPPRWSPAHFPPSSPPQRSLAPPARVRGSPAAAPPPAPTPLRPVTPAPPHPRTRPPRGASSPLLCASLRASRATPQTSRRLPVVMQSTALSHESSPWRRQSRRRRGSM